MKTLIDKINAFESGDENIANFNKIFSDSPITGFFNDDYVTIGFPCSPETVREVVVNGVKSLRHDFRPRLGEFPAPAEDDSSFIYEREEKEEIIRGKNTKVVCNVGNIKMSREEMGLKPSHYFVLQYLRGCETDLHTRAEIATNLKMSRRGVYSLLKEMTVEGILEVSNLPKSNQSKTKIVLNKKWLDTRS